MSKQAFFTGTPVTVKLHFISVLGKRVFFFLNNERELICKRQNMPQTCLSVTK